MKELAGGLNELDMETLGKLVPEKEFRDYFIAPAGREHYRLLAKYSIALEDGDIIDIGTYKGCSALALSYNSRNRVHTFDIENKRTVGNRDNVTYYLDDILNGKYNDLIAKSPLIFLDTLHDGVFENEFFKYLLQSSYRGLLILDDINLNDVMRNFWRGIKNSDHLSKWDITECGHWSGTGWVAFNLLIDTIPDNIGKVLL